MSGIQAAGPPHTPGWSRLEAFVTLAKAQWPLRLLVLGDNGVFRRRTVTSECSQMA